MAKQDKHAGSGGGGRLRDRKARAKARRGESDRAAGQNLQPMKTDDKAKAKADDAKAKADEKRKAKAEKKAKAKADEKAKAKAKKKAKGEGKAKAKADKKRKGPKLTKAQRADRHALYQEAVQAPEADVEFFERAFRRLRGRPPVSMREDFCGTALLSCTWVQSDPERRAIGIDLDAPTLAWGREHNVDRLDASQRERVTLVQANVLDGAAERTDVTCAMNFSYNVFKTRDELRKYFEVVHDRLEDDGVFFTELFGGLEAVVALEEKRKCPGFTYVWDQASYNPISHEMLCHIHFEFSDRSKIERAFSYDWRLWTLPELRELLREVGFRDVQVYWEQVDVDGDGTGTFHPTEYEENQESWLVYIVAAK
jgi:SAM-dependent methyltransferase